MSAATLTLPARTTTAPLTLPARTSSAALTTPFVEIPAQRGFSDRFSPRFRRHTA